MEAELAAISRIDPVRASHRDVERELRALGWARCGEGDWAIALRSPSGQLAARVSPFDPACAYQVELCGIAPPSPYLARIDLHADLEGGGCLQIMELLEPVDEDSAAALRHRVASGGADDPALAEACARIERVHALARRTLRWCGGLDLNAGNVMRARDGQLKLVDLFFMQGRELYGHVLSDPRTVLALLPPARRRYMLEIPYLLRAASEAERAALRSALASVEEAECPG